MFLLKTSRFILGNKIYFAEQLAFDIHAGMNTNTEDLNAGGIFNYAYSSATRTVEFSIQDGLNYKVKIPTNDELANYVNNTWDTVSANYDGNNPVSINYLLSNYVPIQSLNGMDIILSKSSSFQILVHLISDTFRL